jgi:hypothetical protein
MFKFVIHKNKNMKKLFLLTACCFSLMLSAQDSSKYELARLIKTSVMLKDTTTLNTVSNRYGSSEPIATYITQTYFNFMEPVYFTDFKEKVLKMAYSKDAHIFSNWDLKNGLSASEIKEMLVLKHFKEIENPLTGAIDSITDETSTTENISVVDFYETWYYNQKNNMIEKDVLAYQVMINNIDVDSGESRGLKGLFIIVRDEEARKKILRIYSYK